MSNSSVHLASSEANEEEQEDVSAICSTSARSSQVTENIDLTASAFGSVSASNEDQGAAAMASGKEHNPSGLLSVSKDSQMLDTIMQRMKSDLMYELRHLQHGDRPVTGQGHRDNLHQFMLKHCDSQRPSGGPANVDSVEEHRPEAVVVEVQGMIESRPVSSVLQSPAFRRQLENVIRGGLISARQSRTSAAANRQVTQQRLQQTRQLARTSPANPSVNQRRHNERFDNTETSHAELESSAASPPLQRSESTESISSFSSALSHADEELFVDDLEDDEIVSAEPHNHTESSPSDPPLRLPRSVFLNRNSPDPSPSEQGPEPSAQNDTDRGAGVSLNYDISHIQREEMVQEISELLHSRLVSSTLESEFRATLELLAQEHVQVTGHNGQAVQDFVRSLPGRGIPRNDFTHMMIPAAGGVVDADSEDSVSVVSVNAHAVPYVQTNTYLGREIQSLREQMSEMKSMLKLTFDLQMDIQRSIRQEVAAALNNFAGASGVSASATPPSHPVSDTHCLICLDRHTDTVLYQCGHMCVCYRCGRDLVSRGHSCPVCRAPIKDVIRAYKTNGE